MVPLYMGLNEAQCVYTLFNHENAANGQNKEM